MKHHNKSSIQAGPCQKIKTSTPGSNRVANSTLEHVDFTDELGVVHRIGFDPSGLVNLSQLAALVGRSVEAYLSSTNVGALRQHLRQVLGDEALIIIPRVATRSKSGRRLRISARPPGREWWVHPAIAAYFLEYVDEPVVHAWFQWQRATRGWSRPSSWNSEFGFQASGKATVIEELRPSPKGCLPQESVALKPLALMTRPTAKTQLEKLAGMSPVANTLVAGLRTNDQIDREASALLAMLDDE